MILTDGKIVVSDRDEEELHTFWEFCGYRRNWFNDYPPYPHYRLTTEFALLRIMKKLNVERVSSKELGERHWINKEKADE